MMVSINGRDTPKSSQFFGESFHEASSGLGSCHHPIPDLSMDERLQLNRSYRKSMAKPRSLWGALVRPWDIMRPWDSGMAQ